MAEAFDAGSLSWVKDEIDRSLKKVQESFTVVANKPSEFASLRFTVAHLFQVSGALDMVGLEGCKRYCLEIEKLTNKLEKQEIAVTNELMTQLSTAVATLSQYLQDLLNGLPDRPTQLFDTLKPLVEAQGEVLEITELFFPDIDFSAPKDLPTQSLAEFAVPIFVTEQRTVFQKSLLDWLRSSDASALARMRDALANVQQVQHKNAQKTLWWVATGLMDALAQSSVAHLNGAKKLCRRLDQQLRNMAEGETKAPSQLLRDALYYVAISDSNTDTLTKIKEVFELENALPTAANQSHIVTDSETTALAKIAADLPAIKDAWEKMASSQNLSIDLTHFVNKLSNIKSAQNGLNQTDVVDLFVTLDSTAQSLASDVAKFNEISAIEIASSLNLVEFITQHYAQLDAELHTKVSTQIARLRAISDGVPLLPALDSDGHQNKLDGTVVAAVAKQVLAALQQVEKALDGFFRNPDDASVLVDAETPLQQVLAAFDMLELAAPKSIATLSTAFVAYFKKNVGKTDINNFELVAESLSMLGLYAEAMPNVRAEAQQALADAVNRMQERAKELGLAVEDVSLTQFDAEQKVEDVSEAIVPVGEQTPTIVSAPTDNDFTEEVTDQALDDELQDIFLAEAEEVLANIANYLKLLSVNATDSEALADLRRAYHTLKGSGRTVGLVGMSKVAWSVEKLLNLIIELKALPSPAHLDFVERVAGAFSRCVGHLQADKKVTLNPSVFQKEAAEFERVLELALLQKQEKPKKEEVLIGGTRKLSLEFFNIFINEAQQHLTTLLEAQQALKEGDLELPSDASCRAAHTLGSNALAAGFNPTGELSRALEHWLDEHRVAWSAQHITLYGNVVRALDDGLTRIKALKNPKSARALILALSESTAKMQAEAAQQAELASLELEKEIQAAGIPLKQLKLKAGKAQKAPATVQQSEQATNEPQADSTPTEPAVEIEQPMPEEMAVAAEALALSAVVEPQILENVEVVKNASEDKLPATAADQELLNLFLEESRDLMPQVGRDLRGWRSNPHEVEYSDSLQRALHTLKGSARMAGLGTIGDSVHLMEDRVIHALRNNVNEHDFDEMFAEFDRIGYMLEDVSGVTKQEKLAEVAPLQKSKAAPATRNKDRQYQYLRMRADVLDRLINEAGEVSIMRSRMDREMQNFKQSSTDLTDSISRMRAYLRELELEAETQMQSRMSLLQEANESFDPLEFDRFTRLQELTRMMAESVNDVATVQHNLLLNLDQTDAALQQQNRMNRELQQGLMGVRMLPFATIAERMQRIVRQTARELNKRVEMTIEGESIEIDRGVLDKMGAPLEHLLRNAVAHGLESTAQRKKLGKPETGHIKLKISVENDEITLVVTDDGAGIDLAKVKQKAIEKGLLDAQQEVSDQALMAVIFEPGFSTADTISQIAGRGVGLDVVRSDIAALSGRIDVSNVAGQGAMFNIYLPVTLSVAQVVMARVGHQLFAIPSVMIEQVQKLKVADLANAYQAQHIVWSDREYPLHYFAKLIGDANLVAEQHVYTPIVLLRSGTYRIALHVDEILGNQEVVMKQIGTQLARVPGMIGATVLGDGEIVLVVNAVQLANREALAVGAVKATTFAPVVEKLRKIVLVVDDSLTMRKVLSRVLEREDFEVITANDGMDAIQKLQDTTPDIILTDIEMPRMDGFEFSRHVRDNSVTKNIPLIVISSRTADKHRNVATEIGVNAFLGKPVQDEELIAQVNALLKQ
ncbi:MAG TPA: Hpt domain-containing protein [Methylotenera sp.]|nr:Hpt domain-containing protein [Methylotenera sp.]HPH06050.1 Hpt domain-containing protein [Methylotenera sp.]HPN00943.1 Hpt domain-containing protein [Methylotenera sp.]